MDEFQELLIGRLIINDLRFGMAEFIGFFEIWGWGAYPEGICPSPNSR
jgi:hypothetical protein